MGRAEVYNDGKLNRHVILALYLSAAGGLLLGYDVGVIGGVSRMPSFTSKFFPELALSYDKNSAGVAAMSVYCNPNNARLNFFVGSMFITGAIAAFCCSWLMTKIGRKWTMVTGAACFVIGSALQAGAQDLAMLILARIFVGIGSGIACVASPVFLSELAPYKWRGMAMMNFGIQVFTGTYISSILNAKMELRSIGTGQGWRFCLGFSVVPGLMYLVNALQMPDTPNSLIVRGKNTEARAVLEVMRGTKDVDAEFTDMQDSATRISGSGPWSFIFTRRFRPQLWISVLIPLFGNGAVTGWQSILFYSPQMFVSVHSRVTSDLVLVLILACVVAVGLFTGLGFSDYTGRRSIFLIGGIGMFVFLIIVGAIVGSDFINYPGLNYPGYAAALPATLQNAYVAMACMYTLFVSGSWFMLVWAIPAEVQPLETRCAGMSLAVTVYFLVSFCFVMAQYPMLCALQYGVYFFWAACMVGATFFGWYYIPELRHIPTERVMEIFDTHWFWSMYLDGSAGKAASESDTDGAGNILALKHMKAGQVAMTEVPSGAADVANV